MLSLVLRLGIRDVERFLGSNPDASYQGWKNGSGWKDSESGQFSVSFYFCHCFHSVHQHSQHWELWKGVPVVVLLSLFVVVWEKVLIMGHLKSRDWSMFNCFCFGKRREESKNHCLIPCSMTWKLWTMVWHHSRLVWCYQNILRCEKFIKKISGELYKITPLSGWNSLSPW